MERSNGGGGGSDWSSACRSSFGVCFAGVTVSGLLPTVVPRPPPLLEARCAALNVVVDIGLGDWRNGRDTGVFKARTLITICFHIAVLVVSFLLAFMHMQGFVRHCPETLWFLVPFISKRCKPYNTLFVNCLRAWLHMYPVHWCRNV